MNSSPSNSELVEQIRLGSDQAAALLFSRYLDRLISLARSRLSDRLQRRVDPEDVVQSAYRSFFRKVKEDSFRNETEADVWKLLAAITANKARQNIEFHLAEKRSILADHSVNLEMSFGRVACAIDSITKEPSPEQAAIAIEQLERLMSQFDQLQRQMLELRLQGFTIEEVAEQTGRAERTVRRVVEKAREFLREELSTTGL